MGKGVTAPQNIALLRYARAANMSLDWNLLNGFPGDQSWEYEEMRQLLPLLRHLQPPTAFFHLSIDRFSTYFEQPAEYGLTNIRPWPSYEMIMPLTVDVADVAYHFNADYDCGSHRNEPLMHEIEREIQQWQATWQTEVILFFGKFRVGERPVLEVVAQDDGSFILRDTRGLPGTQTTYNLTPAQVSAALMPRRYQPAPEIDWALVHKVGVVLDRQQYVPLATADPQFWLECENKLDPRKREQWAVAG
jgi:hypothetical protein